MATGTVKFFSAQKGYGFIVQDNGGPDVFVDISAVEHAGMHTAPPGGRGTVLPGPVLVRAMVRRCACLNWRQLRMRPLISGG
jgi:cold shock CspA family protein